MRLVCPARAATYRIPTKRLGDAWACGRRAVPLTSTKPVDQSDASRPELIAGTELPVVVGLRAAWCGLCKAMAPAFAAAARQMPEVRIVKLVIGVAPVKSARYRIRSIPTLIILKRGIEIARVSGARSTAQVVSWVQQ